MKTREVEESIIYWSNQVLDTDIYNEAVDVFDGKLFKTLLDDTKLEEPKIDTEFSIIIGDLESTLTTLKAFYSDYPNIVNDRRYRDILINDDEVCNIDQLISITELVIGALLK